MSSAVHAMLDVVTRSGGHVCLSLFGSRGSWLCLGWASGASVGATPVGYSVDSDRHLGAIDLTPSSSLGCGSILRGRYHRHFPQRPVTFLDVTFLSDKTMVRNSNSSNIGAPSASAG